MFVPRAETKPQAGVPYRDSGSPLTVQTQPPASKAPTPHKKKSSHPLTANSACHLMGTTLFINYGELRGPHPAPQGSELSSAVTEAPPPTPDLKAHLLQEVQREAANSSALSHGHSLLFCLHAALSHHSSDGNKASFKHGLLQSAHAALHPFS